MLKSVEKGDFTERTLPEFLNIYQVIINKKTVTDNLKENFVTAFSNANQMLIFKKRLRFCPVAVKLDAQFQ